MATYSLNNFLATPSPGDITLKIYDISRKLKYEINPNIAYFLTKSNIVIIRIEDRNDIYLDFIDTQEAVAAAAKLNTAKRYITTSTTPTGTGMLSENEQRRLAYFHAMSKTMTVDSQKISNSLYKSSHNVRMQEIWLSEIIPCSTYAEAVAQSVINNAVTLHTGATLIQLAGSNGQGWYFTSGGKFIRPWIDPVDVPFPDTYLPSTGFTAMLFRGDDATKGIPGTQISPLEGAWITEYYAGIIHCGVGNTPQDLGWGTIKATFFEYSGDFGISAFRTVSFNSGTNQLIFNSGLSTQEIVDLSSLSGGTGLMASTNINMRANTTTGNGQLACDTGITSAPIVNSYVSVYVNGVKVSVGNGMKNQDCYFSNNSGITAKTWANITVGDKLYWNGNILGYSLHSSTDKISFIYLTP